MGGRGWLIQGRGGAPIPRTLTDLFPSPSGRRTGEDDPRGAGGGGGSKRNAGGGGEGWRQQAPPGAPTGVHFSEIGEGIASRPEEGAHRAGRIEYRPPPGSHRATKTRMHREPRRWRCRTVETPRRGVSAKDLAAESHLKRGSRPWIVGSATGTRDRQCKRARIAEGDKRA